MKTISSRFNWRAERGASLVETALVSLFLLLLIAGVVDLGGAFQNYIVITNAAREGARTAARMPCKTDNRAALRSAIISAVTQEASGSALVISADQITIIPDPVATGCALEGEPVVVHVEIQYEALLGNIVGTSEFPISNSATMAYAGND